MVQGSYNPPPQQPQQQAQRPQQQQQQQQQQQPPRINKGKGGAQKSCKYTHTLQVIAAAVAVGEEESRMILIAQLLINDTSHTVRAWLDIGSSCSLVAQSSAKAFKLQRNTLKKQVLAKGLGGTEIIDFVSIITLSVNGNKFDFSAYWSNFSVLTEYKIDLLLGRDVIGKKLGLTIPLNAPPTITFQEDFSKENLAVVPSNSPQGLSTTTDWRRKNKPGPGEKKSLQLEIQTELAGIPVSHSPVSPPGVPTQVGTGDVNLNPGSRIELGDSQDLNLINETTLSAAEKSSCSSLSKRRQTLALEESAEILKRQKRKKDKLARQAVRSGQHQKKILAKKLVGIMSRYPTHLKLQSKPVKQVTKPTKGKLIHALTAVRPDLRATEIISVIHYCELTRGPRSLKIKDYVKQGKAVDIKVVSPITLTLELDQKLLEEYKHPAALDHPPDREDVWVHINLNENQTSRLELLLGEYSDVICNTDEEIPMGQMDVEPFDIEFVDGGIQQLQENRPKPFPAKGPKFDLLKKSFDELEKFGGGRNNERGVEFASPCFLAKRPRKPNPRLCLAYVDLNKVTKDEIFPTPSIDSILQKLAGKKVFSIIDLRYAYNQVPLTENAKRFAGVIWSGGTFRLYVMSFGLKNAPAYFQRIMQDILKEGLGTYVLVFIDDIVVFSDSIEEHFEDLRKVLLMLRRRNAKALRLKVHLFLEQIKLLGRVVTGHSIEPDPEVVKDILEFPQPHDKHSLRRFLGLVNVYEQFIENYSLIAKPLYAMTGTAPFKKWSKGTVEDEAFVQLKNAMASPKVLRQFDWARETKIQVDASLFGAGGVLLQLHEEFWWPVAFASWLFNAAQRNYSTTDRELLAIVQLLRKWRAYLIARRLLIDSDHMPLPGYLAKDPHGRKARWISELQQFHYKISHIKGKDNVIADGMSRALEEFANSLANHEQIAALVWKDFTPMMIHTSAKVAKDFAMPARDELLPTADSLNHHELIAAIQALKLPTDKDFAVEQDAQEDLKVIITYLKEAKLPEQDNLAQSVLLDAENYCLLGQENVLARITNKEGRTQLRRVVPDNMRKLICSIFHDGIWAGSHLGRDKTFHRISKAFFWNKMRKFIADYCEKCLVCLAHKSPPKTSAARLGTIECDHVWDLVCIDLVKMPTSSNGHRYILTVIDGFSKFAFAIPLASKKAVGVASVLLERVFGILGMPKRLHSDRGGEFVNKVMKSMCKILMIDQSLTTAYHPQGNGYAERIHRFFRNAVASYVNEGHDDWDILLWSILLAYNTAVHSALGVTPAEVLLGRQLNIPGTFFDAYSDLEGYSPKSFTQKLKWILHKTQQLVLQRQSEKIDRNARLSADTQPTKFEVNQWVRVWNPTRIEGLKAKLLQKWYGPYQISRIKSDGKVFYLKDEMGEEVPVPYSINRLDAWKGSLPQEETEQMEIDTAAEMIISEESVDSLDVSEESESEEEQHSSTEEPQPPVVISLPPAEEEVFVPDEEAEPETLIPGLEPIVMRRSKLPPVRYAAGLSRNISSRYNFINRHKKKK